MGIRNQLKKKVTIANHSIIYRTMLNEIKKCEINGSGGLLSLNGTNLLQCSDIFSSTKFHQLFMEDIKEYALQAAVNRLLGKV